MPARVEQLQPTEMYDVKWCEMCLRKVHLCDDDFLLELHAKAGNCLAVFDRRVKNTSWEGQLLPIRLSIR